MSTLGELPFLVTCCPSQGARYLDNIFDKSIFDIFNICTQKQTKTNIIFHEFIKPITILSLS